MTRSDIHLMNPILTTSQKRNGYLKNSTLTLLALGTAFFPRVLTSMRFPSPINFLHFFLIPFACVSTLLKAKGQDAKQIAISRQILAALFGLLIITFASALLNDAGVINAILNFLLLTEPFLLLLTIISLPMSVDSFKRFQTWILRFAFANILFAYFQRYLFQRHKLFGLEDNISGVFIGQGAGHVLAASVSLTFGVYYFTSVKSIPLWLRTIVLLAIFNQIIISDTKQVLLSFIVAYLLLYLINFKNPVKTILYLIGGILFISFFFWAIYQFEFLRGFTTWIRPEIYGPDGEATRLKFATFRIVPEYFRSPLNWLLGLGPGHTVGRLGGWMLDAYKELLVPLGATIHPASGSIWRAVAESWLGNQSSLFSPLFGWAGIWGDLGILGLAVYLYLGFLIWKNVCLTDSSRYLLLTAFVFGCIFSQLEEPGYMLFLAAIIGLQWHGQCAKKLT
jgi:hypothetical protein